jgi:hypothetical protein
LIIRAVKLFQESVYSFKVIVHRLNGVGKIVLREEALVFGMLAAAIYKISESFGSVAPAPIIGSGFPRHDLRLQFSDTSSGFVEYLLLVGAWIVLQDTDKV